MNNKMKKYLYIKILISFWFLFVLIFYFYGHRDYLYPLLKLLISKI